VSIIGPKPCGMSYQLLAGTRAPVRVWTDPWTIEPDAAR
jgi:tRNA-splicing ligase RtcB